MSISHMDKCIAITTCIGQGDAYIKRWYDSLRHCGYTGDVAIITDAKTPLDTKKYIVHRMDCDMNKKVHSPLVIRCLGIYEFLSSTAGKYEWALCTDGRDVVFQTNPFDWIMKASHDMIIGLEGVHQIDEGWLHGLVTKHYRREHRGRFWKKEIINTGCIAGKTAWITDYMLTCFMWTKTCLGERGIDQPAANVFLNTLPWKQHVCLCRDFVHNFGAGLVVAKSKYHGDTVEVRDGKLVRTSDGHIFPCVHQHDRVPHIDKALNAQ